MPATTLRIAMTDAYGNNLLWSPGPNPWMNLHLWLSPPIGSPQYFSGRQMNARPPDGGKTYYFDQGYRTTNYSITLGAGTHDPPCNIDFYFCGYVRTSEGAGGTLILEYFVLNGEVLPTQTSHTKIGTIRYTGADSTGTVPFQLGFFWWNTDSLASDPPPAPAFFPMDGWPTSPLFYAVAVPITYSLIVNITGPGTVSPPHGTVYAPNDTLNFSVLPASGYYCSSFKINDVERVTDLPFSYICPDEQVTIKAIFESIPKIITASATYINSACSGNGTFPVTPGGIVYVSTNEDSMELDVYSEETVTDTLDDQIPGTRVGVWACVADIRSRIASLIVNGHDYVLNPVGSLPLEFVFCGENSMSGGLFFTLPSSNVTISVTFISNAFCYPGAPILIGSIPPVAGTGSSIGGPGGPGGPGGSTEPGGGSVPQTPNYPIIKPGDSWGDSHYPFPVSGGNPPINTPSWWPSGSPPNSIIGANGRRIFGYGDLPSGCGIDWLNSNESRRLILKWKDDGKWSKEHVIDLGKTGETNICRWIVPHGKYRARQYQLVLIDRIPCIIVYLEEENEVE